MVTAYILNKDQTALVGLINSLHAGNFFMLFCHSANFFSSKLMVSQISFFSGILSECQTDWSRLSLENQKWLRVSLEILVWIPSSM